MIAWSFSIPFQSIYINHHPSSVSSFPSFFPHTSIPLFVMTHLSHEKILLFFCNRSRFRYIEPFSPSFSVYSLPLHVTYLHIYSFRSFRVLFLSSSFQSGCISLHDFFMYDGMMKSKEKKNKRGERERIQCHQQSTHGKIESSWNDKEEGKFLKQTTNWHGHEIDYMFELL